MIFELCDTGYGIRVNGTEFASFEDWLKWEFQEGDEAPLTEFVDRKEGENDAENRYELCPGEAV